MTRHPAFSICVVSLALVAPRAHASEAPALEQVLAARPVVNGPLSIERATEIALRESPVVRGAGEEVEAALGRLQVARAQSRPALSTTSFVTGGSEGSIYTTTDLVRPMNLFAVPRGSFFDQNAILMFPLYTGGRLQALTRQATAAQGSASADREGVRQEVALMTRTAYREVLARRATVEVAQTVITDTEERLRIDREKAQAGSIPPFYVQRDEAELANAQQQLTNSKRDTELALLQLKTVMGVHPDSRPEVVGPLGFEPAAPLLDRLAGPTAATGTSLVERYRSRLLALALRQRPELRSAQLRVEQAEHGISAVKSAYRPQVGVGAMFDFMTGAHADPFGGTSFGLTASLPLFDSGLRRANVKTAEADRRHRQADYERTAIEVTQQVTSALLSLEAAEQNVTTAQTAVRSARAEHNVMLQRYQAGRGVLVEVLDALTARTRAETNVVQALYEYNVAQDQLRRAIGQPVSPAGVSMSR